MGIHEDQRRARVVIKLYDLNKEQKVNTTE
jgi:hypothetical protein